MIQLFVSVGLLRLARLGARELQEACVAAGNGVAERVRAHFRALPGARFWQEAADATRVVSGGRGVEVWVEKRGVALQWRGGVVLPGRGRSSATGAPTRLLAIPAVRGVSEAPGRYAPLVFVPVRGRGHVRGLLLPGVAGVARRSGRRHRRGEPIVRAQAGAQPLFRLVDRTSHRPHPDVLPGLGVLRAAAAHDVGRYVSFFGLKRDGQG